MASTINRLAALLAAVPITQALYTDGNIVVPCDSPIYCHGDLLREVELARPFSDSKTFVDMPGKKPLDEILAAFEKLEKPLKNDTVLQDFLSEYFAEPGGELVHVPPEELSTDPAFLDEVNDTVIREFVSKVIDIWPDLTRSYVGSGECSDCPDSFLPVNRTFVVAGGRFREPYYWDSYWIVEGLLRTGGDFVDISKNIIENFLDFVNDYGFVPNGARKYYLNRSQPPLLSQMVKAYVHSTNDTSILDRAVPLLIKEHEFFINNRSVTVTVGNKSYTLNQYNVDNNQPRPESFREDYITANNASYYAKSGIIYPEVEKLTDEQKALVYKNLATGAESGWDYSSRWISRPRDAADDVYFPLRYLNIVGTVPVDLNSILYGNEIAIAELLEATGDEELARKWRSKAEDRSAAMYATMWNETLNSYFDFNLTSNAQNIYVPADDDTADFERFTAPEDDLQVSFSAAQFYPFWTGAAPSHLKDNPLAVKLAYDRVARYLDLRAGGIPATNFRTGEQWDQPNVWPPLIHILISGLLNTPPTFTDKDPSYRATQDLALSIAQRYLDSTFCTWYATGGSTSETPQLPGLTDEDKGVMFEKYSDAAINRVGGGGEYEVVEGFGWTNGVLIWIVDTFKNDLRRPDCGEIEAANVHPGRKL
ncbi:Trehalase [Scedosporium apiospermum]|uniref:Trehalase n=1 Tax=Pseudallescheria apiosperma TaxID=563466 RepID=A0A084GAD4_PSEDA|nr:Trehalase [Scedosporium apiospermum]KEZ44296.1 Trehalase [Scedosporium apiospermum]